MNATDFILPIAIATTLYMILFLDKQKKLRAWQAFWLALGCWLMIATIVWLATVLQLYGLKESKNVWDIASMVFTFLGTALTVGTAIAGITALLSYISINDKLKKAEQDLNSAQEKLTEFQELHQHSIKLKQQIDDIEKYQVLIQDLDNTKIADTETNQAAESAAEQILKSNYSQFEHRLKARAILDSITARKQFDEIRQNPSADAWQQNITARGEIMALWQLLYQGSNQSNLETNQANYASAVFNYGASYSFASDYYQNNKDKTVYLDLLHQASKQYALALQINPNLHKAANNWGVALSAKANVLSDTEFVEKCRLWQLAEEKYALALNIKSDYHDAANNWGITLSYEAEALPNTELTEKRQLWQKAGEKYALALDIKSDFHHETATNWGNVLNNEANALPNTELAEKRRLWQEAGKKYASALQIQPNRHEAANNWRIALNREANALPDTEWEEKFNLWQNALKKVQDLQNLSEKHQQSSAIQNLVNQIEQQIADLEKRKPSS